jgi:hypothetical protein
MIYYVLESGNKPISKMAAASTPPEQIIRMIDGFRTMFSCRIHPAQIEAYTSAINELNLVDSSRLHQYFTQRIKHASDNDTSIYWLFLDSVLFDKMLIRLTQQQPSVTLASTDFWPMTKDMDSYGFI